MSFKPCKNVDCKNLVDTEGIRRYCCDACRQRAYRVRQNQKGKRPLTAEVKNCQNCGRRFCSLIASQTFCKTSCRVSFFQQQKRLASKESGVLPK